MKSDERRVVQHETVTSVDRGLHCFFSYDADLYLDESLTALLFDTCHPPRRVLRLWNPRLILVDR